MPIFHNDSLDDPLIFDRLPSFSGGQVSFERANVLQPNQAALLQNVTILINGELRKRRGTRPLGSGFVAEERLVQGLIHYDTSARQSLIAFCDQRALAYENGRWDLAFDAGLSSSGEKPDIVQLTDDLYWTDSGLSGIRKWDGSTVTTITASPAATILERHGTRLVASGVAAVPDAIYFSDFLDGESWDMARGEIRIGGGDGDPVVAVKSWQDTGLLVFKRNSTWLVEANPLVSVAEFSVKLIHRTIGCSAKRSVAQVGQDVWFLSRTGVQSVSKQLATSNNEISVPVSQAIQDIVQRIRWDHAHKACGIFYNNYYLLSVPVNSDTPDTVLVFHYLTGGWTTFTEWDAELLYEQPFDGTSRLLLGRSDGEIRTWLDYYPTQDEPNDAYQDGSNPLLLSFALSEEGAFFPPGNDVTSTIRTRAMTFSDPVSPKSGFYGEFELVTASVSARITALRDGRLRTSVKSLSYELPLPRLPATLPFHLAAESWRHERFPIHHLAPFRELQYEIASPSGKLVLRDVNTSAFMDTVETIATPGTLAGFPQPDPFEFFPPEVTLTGNIDGGDLVLLATLGDGTFGTYELAFRVAGNTAATATADAQGPHTIRVPLDAAWVTGGALIAEVQAISIFPLPAWSATATATISTTLPAFWPGSVTGSPGFSFGAAVDYQRGFAYAIKGIITEWGVVCRIDLTTGRIDELPVSAAYGLYLRPSDGSLFLEQNRGYPNDFTLRRYMPHLWSPGDPLPALTTGDAVDINAEAGAYSDTLDAILIPRQGAIDSYPAATLASPTLYETTGTYYGVHGLRWEDGRSWWIEGDQSYGHRWSAGSTIFTTGPSYGSDIVPVPHLGRAVLIGSLSSTRGAWVADATTGEILHSLPGHGHAGPRSCYRVGSQVIVFDGASSVAREIDAATGDITDHALPAGKTYITGFTYRGRRIALPHTGASWADPDCGIATW
jgi:hypothetical protein